MEVLNICLSDIDKSKIFTAKNGKTYGEKPTTAQQQEAPQPQEEETDDLPF